MSWLEELLTGMPDFAEALCAQTDPEAFFPEKGGSTRAAKALCQSCADQLGCLEYALASRQRFGIWGGTSGRDRQRIAHARGIDWSEKNDFVDHDLPRPARTVDDDTRRRLSEAAYARHAARRAAQASPDLERTA